MPTSTPVAKKVTAKKAPAAKRPVKKAPASAPVPGSVFREIPHEFIEPNLDNIRTRVEIDDALRELSDDIRDRGVQQPITVTVHPDDSDRYVLIMGERRWTAAGMLDTPPLMPAIVRPAYADRTDLLADMWSENHHRADLTPVEDARVFEQMSVAGLTDEAIAVKVNAKVEFVKERRQLAKLPEDRQRRLHEGQVTIEQGLAMVEFADDERALREIDAARQPYEFRNAVQSARLRRETKQKKDAIVAQLKKERVQFLDEIPAGQWWNSPHVLGRNEGLPANREDHDKTGCTHLAAAFAHGTELAWLCLDPTVHGGPMPGQTDAVEEAEAAAEAAAEEQDAAAFAAAALARRDFVRDRITGQVALGRVEELAITMHGALQLGIGEPAIEREETARWVGDDELADAIRESGGWADPGSVENDLLHAAIEKLPPARALLAVLAASHESSIANRSSWTYGDGLGERLDQADLDWLNLLGGPLGHEWTWEAPHIDAAQTRLKETAAERDRQAAEGAKAMEDAG